MKGLKVDTNTRPNDQTDRQRIPACPRTSQDRAAWRSAMERTHSTGVNERTNPRINMIIESGSMLIGDAVTLKGDAMAPRSVRAWSSVLARNMTHPMVTR